MEKIMSNKKNNIHSLGYKIKYFLTFPFHLIWAIFLFCIYLLLQIINYMVNIVLFIIPVFVSFLVWDVGFESATRNFMAMEECSKEFAEQVVFESGYNWCFIKFFFTNNQREFISLGIPASIPNPGISLIFYFLIAILLCFVVNFFMRYFRAEMEGETRKIIRRIKRTLAYDKSKYPLGIECSDGILYYDSIK